MGAKMDAKINVKMGSKVVPAIPGSSCCESLVMSLGPRLRKPGVAPVILAPASYY